MTPGAYVAGAYLVFAAVLIAYVTILATRLARTRRDLLAHGYEPEDGPR